MKQMKKPDYRLAKSVDLEIRLLDDEEAPAGPGLYTYFILVILLAYEGFWVILSVLNCRCFMVDEILEFLFTE